MNKKKSSSKKSKNISNPEHYIKVCQVLIGSIILEEDFSQHIDDYHNFGPEAIEEMTGELLNAFIVEMELISSIVQLLCDDSICNHCVLKSSVEIEDPYLRRRHFEVVDFLTDEWELVEELVKELVSVGKISKLLDDDVYLNVFMEELKLFNENIFTSEDNFVLETKKEIKMLN